MVGVETEVVWTDPALADLDAIGDYIALDNPQAARGLIQRVFARVDQLAAFPLSGSVPSELGDSRYRQLVEPPCRVLYRHDPKTRRVHILHVIRSERLLREDRLAAGDDPSPM
ncbi:type II toxin-antitoxin system RelE/ParE family toxin [Nevskia sp.]|uniref:type II toxin-antitoxin system RelE/ParE family toxin n=1 Tax=Nevskia sp. TaxID=1929292 RepID=UPI0025D3BE77|nr:type II toxin-antitoxin system RelE/ParE family toxin [Nevskia sp.]